MSTRTKSAPEPEKTPDAAAAAETAAADAPAADAPAADAPAAEPATGETAWFETGTGQHEVEVGSQAYENLVQQGATRIEAPTATDEATDEAKDGEPVARDRSGGTRQPAPQ
jgi:hypothetical protein